MTLKELIVEIKNLNSAEQHRLKEFFINSIASFSASELVFQEVTERKNTDGYTCIYCSSKQIVRNDHSRLKRWMQRFNGVATKYLDQYLSWFQFLDIVKHRKDNTTIRKMIVNSCLYSTNATYDSIRLSKLSNLY